MAASTGPFKASGSTLGYKTTLAGTSYTNVGELINFDLGGVDIAKIDTTLLSSVAKTSLASIPDNGDVTFSVFLVPSDATFVQLFTWSQLPLTVFWEIQIPDGTTATSGSTITFTAYVSGFAPKGFEVDSSPMADVTLTISGSMTLTAGS